jgi:hypothetical protein
MFSVGAGKDIISSHFSSCVFSITLRHFSSAESKAEKMASGEVLSMLSVNRAGSILTASVVDSPSSHSAKSRSTKIICESKSRTVAEPAMSILTSSACECWLNQSCQRRDSCCVWSRNSEKLTEFLGMVVVIVGAPSCSAGDLGESIGSRERAAALGFYPAQTFTTYWLRCRRRRRCRLLGPVSAAQF